MARNRIIYGSQSVWCNGHVLYRVQTLGSTTTFTSEDLFELGHMDIIDVVDDVPAVAVTLNTNDFGDVKTMAVLAQVSESKIDMNATASGTDPSNANLAVVSGTQLTETGTYLHGVCLADFAIVCGALPGVSIWAPVQDECDLGTLSSGIEQTLYMDEVFVNSLELGYTTGANATENYGAETDNKTWLLNQGRFVNWEEFIGTDFDDGVVELEETAVDMTDEVPGFLRSDIGGARAVTYYNSATDEMLNYEVKKGTIPRTDCFVFDPTTVPGTDSLYAPTTLSGSMAAADKVFAVYASDHYADTALNAYFVALTSADTRPAGIGAIRQGQVEIYIVADADTAFTNAWRLTGCTVTSDLTREPLAELGRLGPYDRPLTMPIPITVTIDTTAGDLTHWARFADRYTAFDNNTMKDIDLADLMAKEDLKLVVKVFYQTDEEAGGTGDGRKVLAGSDLVGESYLNDGVEAVYSASDTERALKTIVVEHLKMTDEAYTLDMGTNATQTFGFRSTNDLYVVKGDLSITHITNENKIRRNA